MGTISKVFVGVDVSKKYLDGCLLPINKHFRVSNNKKGFMLILKRLNLLQVEQVVCEASGGYEQKFIRFLDDAKYKTWIVDPKRIKFLAKAEDIKAKTDKIDAKTIAIFASRVRKQYDKNTTSQEERKLKELVLRRTELVAMLAKEKTRLKGPTREFYKEMIESLIDFLEGQLEDIEIQIAEIINNNYKLKKQSEILETVPGVGKATSATLLATLSELGTLNSKQIASLVGVAPITKESGNRIGQAHISGGRVIARKAIYMAALTAIRSNPVLKIFYNQLISRGKKAKVALVAVMRKLVVILNAMLRDGIVWAPKMCENWIKNFNLNTIAERSAQSAKSNGSSLFNFEETSSWIQI